MSLTLTRDSVKPVHFADGLQHSWPVRITAVSTISGLPSEIFVYHAVGQDSATNEDLFECVASVQQITELPATAPQGDPTGKLIPYYRKAVLEAHCRSADEADELWDKVKDDANDLVVNFRAFGNMTATDTYVIA